MGYTLCYILFPYSHRIVRRKLGFVDSICHSSPSYCPTMSSRTVTTASTSKSSDKGRSAVVVPRPSASLVVVNGQNEVLLVQRNPRAVAFGGVTVFPGGNYDRTQDDSFEITAIRETFEESGLLMASPTTPGGALPTDSVLDEARHAIHSQKMRFREFLDQHGLKPDTDSLMPFTQWITPVGPPRRFHTRFYVSFLPSASSSGFTSGDKQARLPKPDGGKEVITARFLHPKAAIAEFDSQKITFMPPQYYILHTLASILKGSVNTPEQRAKVRELAYGKFGRMVINPRRLKGAEEAAGLAVLTYEGDETRGGSPGRRHRATIFARQGGITEKIVLERNFDIYTEIEENAFLQRQGSAVASKL
ncbi:hypothetical protein E1B28_009192 [Marasmius oreades]|uniref:Nudix hydrolase domain-containing protein n=1 Tax=Marasmius oreades TaxID=181124 RepID=A0A9P7USJ9_9AGAR|nr:uncharacterized protein E1B28_009192 [Marasmius oreades]KAG7092882.1 hypothetical protein E1B28_009192 [Marasmius oreades]